MPTDRLLIPYGGRRWPVDRLDRERPDPDLGPLVEIDLGAHEPLRLGNFPYVFAEPPDFNAIAATQERLDFLREHLKSYWGIWDKLALAFLDAYFEFIRTAIDASREALTAQAAPHGGLFQYRDWSFAALAPIPIAHVHVPASEQASWVCVDFAFWTGDSVIVLDIVGSDDNRTRRQNRERLRHAGHDVIEFPSDTLRRGDAQNLHDRLPPLFSNFWNGMRLPSSPFRIGSLGAFP